MVLRKFVTALNNLRRDAPIAAPPPKLIDLLHNGADQPAMRTAALCPNRQNANQRQGRGALAFFGNDQR